MKYKNLIFDIDGTLWDSRGIIARGYNAQLIDEGYEHLCVTVEDLGKQFGKVTDAIADALFASVPAPERYELMLRCMARQTLFLREDPCQVEYPDVKQTIARLAQDHRLFIVSNSEAGYPQLCIDKLGLQDYIQDHLCFGDTGTSKGRSILTLMERNGITAADTIYIGDTQGDYEATVEAGIPFLWCTYGFGKPEHWESKIDSFAELLTL